MIFRWGGDGMYGGAAHGPHYPFIHRGAEELLPVIEIETCLKHLDADNSLNNLISQFWEIREHLESSPTTSSESPMMRTDAPSEPDI